MDAAVAGLKVRLVENRSGCDGGGVVPLPLPLPLLPLPLPVLEDEVAGGGAAATVGVGGEKMSPPLEKDT